MSVVKKCFNTVEPKEPVPPVITKVLFLNASVMLFKMISSSLILSAYLIAIENISSRYFTLLCCAS